MWNALFIPSLVFKKWVSQWMNEWVNEQRNERRRVAEGWVYRERMDKQRYSHSTPEVISLMTQQWGIPESLSLLNFKVFFMALESTGLLTQESAFLEFP